MEDAVEDVFDVGGLGEGGYYNFLVAACKRDVHSTSRLV